jgi:tetratricopeptide (TPR) repeat protein
MMTNLREQVERSLGDGYSIDRELGGGGMSRVFVAHDATLHRDVVIKVLPPELLAGVNLERFRREILVAAGLQHPHIVPVLSSGESDGLPWFSMPLVQGESLRQRLARGPLPISEAISIMREVAKALAYAHERGVVHRDIKPDNVLITGGTAVVTDFGIAKALSASRSGEEPGDRNSLTQVGTSIGTPVYMAPEQAAADPNTDARADLYSFGCMAYELLAGRPPFVGMPPQRLLAAHMGERPRNITELRRDTPPPVADLVMHCLEKDPDKRPATASDVVRVLDLASNTSGSAAAASSVLLGGRVSLRAALGVWVLIVGAAWLLAKAAIVGIGLPTWVLPGALIVALLGLPAILFTAYVQRTARRVLTTTPTLTPGGTTAPRSTMATIAVKASPHVSWNRTARGGIVAFAVFALGIAAFMTMRALGIGPAASLLSSGSLSAREPLLVTDFSVHGGDSSLAGIVAEAMRASLQQSNTVTLVPPSAVAGAIARMQEASTGSLTLARARAIAQRIGVKAVLDGDVTAIGNGFLIAVRLVTADSGRTLAAVQQVADAPKDLISTVDAVGRELRGKMGESLRSVRNAPALAEVTTPSLDALRAYSEGARAYDVNSDFATAIPRLLEAVTIDTGFAMAWRKLAVAYAASGYPQAAADSALRHAFRLRARLTTQERLMTEATYYFLGPGHNRALSAAASEQMLANGDTAQAGINLGLIYESRRQYARADSLYRAAVRNRGPVGVSFVDLSAVLVDEGRLHDALAVLDSVAAHDASPSSRDNVRAIRVAIFSAAAAYDSVWSTADGLIAGSVPYARYTGFEFRGAVAGVRGRLADARVNLQLASAAMPIAARPAPLADSIAVALLDVTAAAQPARAIRRLESALAATPLQSLKPADRDYLGVATVYARAGRPAAARRILAQRAASIDTARFRAELPLLYRANGEIAIAENRPLDAVREFWKGDSLPDGPYDSCDACTYVNVARAYDHASAADSSIKYFEKFFGSTASTRINVDVQVRAPAARRLGELYEGRGDRAKAIHYYRMFTDLWKNADPELQPQVTEVRSRLARLEKSTG